MELVHFADRLASIVQRYPPESKECIACAHEVWQLLRSVGLTAEVMRVTHALLGQYFHTQDGVCFAETGFHVTMRVNNLLIDALTGSEGKPQQNITLYGGMESRMS